MHVGIVGPCSSVSLADLLPYSGGVALEWPWTNSPVVNLVRALIGRGHYVSVITLSPEVKERVVLKGPKLNYYVYPTRISKRIRNFYKTERYNLIDGINLADPDILHAHWTYEFSLACLDTDWPTLVTCHDNAFRVLKYNTCLHRLARLYIQIRVIRKALFLTAVSPYLANYLQHMTKTKIEVVPNPVEEISHKNERPYYRDFSNISIATVINGWQKLKNPKIAIESFNLFRSNLPNANMFMYGSGFEEGGPASKWARRKGLCQNIHFCGPLPYGELQRELRRMSILLHPSLEEACPMAVLEAMGAGLIVVGGTNSGGVPWVLDNGMAGFLTEVRNPKKIAETLLYCIQQTEDREQKRKNAYSRLNFFSPDSIARKYEDIYEKVLSEVL